MSGQLTRTLLDRIDPSRLGGLKRSLLAQAAKYEPEQSQFPRRLRYPGGGEEWTGDASDALQVQGQDIGKTFGVLCHKDDDAAAQCDQGEGHIANAKSVAQGEIAETEALAVGMDVNGRHWDCGEPFGVADDLTVHVKAVPAGAPWEVGNVLNAMAAERTVAIARVVAQLVEVSITWGVKIKAAMDLGQLALDSMGRPYASYDPNRTVRDVARGIGDGTIPVPSDPYVLKYLWQQLTPEEKEKIYDRHHDIGNHGGIPFDPPDHLGRDHYNKQHLDDLVPKTKAEVDRIQAEHPEWVHGVTPSPKTGGAQYQQWSAWRSRLDAAQHDLDCYNTVLSTLDKSKADGQPRFLGILDEKGHAAVSTYNPDLAKKNGTLVPGTTADMSQMGRYDDNSQRIIKSALDASHGQLHPGDVSVTTWMGYERPMSVFDPFSDKWAGDSKFALEGARALDDYQDGIRASHNDNAAGGRAYQTVIGHSYGSTEVGAAATHGNHLDADAVALLASPGSFADNAHGLAINEGGKVFVGKSNFDPIMVANFGSAIGASDLGSDPADWKDAYQMDAGSGGHSSYFESGNPAMDNLGRIVIGEDGSDGVTPKK